LRRHEWGHVEGIERDGESIENARATYPEIVLEAGTAARPTGFGLGDAIVYACAT
jgi:hypothetical protein